MKNKVFKVWSEVRIQEETFLLEGNFNNITGSYSISSPRQDNLVEFSLKADGGIDVSIEKAKATVKMLQYIKEELK